MLKQTDNKNIFILYIVYYLSFFIVFTKTRDSALSEYTSSVLIIVIFFTFLSLNFLNNKYIKMNFFLLSMIIIFFMLLAPIIKTYFYAIVLYIEVLLISLFFSRTYIKKESFIKFLNITYLSYLLVSILVWINLIPNFVYDASFFYVNEFYVDLGFIGWYILPGFDGSPAGLDAYSAAIAIINILFNTKRSKSIFIVFAIIGVVLTFRLTPFMIFIFVGLTYYFYKYKYFSIFLMFSIFMSFILVLYLLYIDYSFLYNGKHINIWELGYVVTHARTMIWVQQLDILFDTYTLFDYIFGKFSISLFGVPHYQLWGAIRGDEFHGNPHNTFLLLFFRAPLLFLIMFIIFIYTVFSNYNQKRFTVIFILFLASFTNSSIISLGNPIFLIILIYFLIYKEKNETKKI